MGAQTTGQSHPFDGRPLTATLGVEIEGVDLSRRVDDGLFSAILDAFHERCVLLFRGQELTPARLVEFSRRFGEIDQHVDEEYLLPGHPEIMVVGNVIEDGVYKSLFVNRSEEWHSDLVYKKCPNLGSLLYAVEVPPEGADTCFAGMFEAHDALSDETKARIEGLRAVHDFACLDAQLRRQEPDRPPMSEALRRANPPVTHPIVRTHPVSGRKSIYVSPAVISRVEGMDAEEGHRLVDDLARHATRPEFVYRHKWRDGDLVVWDNRCTMHTATPFDHDRYRRVMYRTAIVGDEPV